MPDDAVPEAAAVKQPRRDPDLVKRSLNVLVMPEAQQGLYDTIRRIKGNLIGPTYIHPELAQWLYYVRPQTTAVTKQYWELISELLPAETLKLATCDRCGAFLPKNGLVAVEGERDFVCADCALKWYIMCQDCRKRFHKHAKLPNSGGKTLLHQVGGYGWLDEDCYVKAVANKQFFECDECKQTYHRNYRAQHVERGDYCQQCNPPDASTCKTAGKLDFEFPALCLEVKAIKADEIVAVSIGGGTIGQTGLIEIGSLILRKTGNKTYGGGLNITNELYGSNPEIGAEFQTKEGNFTKRLARYLLVNRSMKLNEEFMNEIGQMAQKYVSKPRDLRISITRDLNQPARRFANDGSCWWGGYYHTRCAFKGIGGMALRTFDAKGKVTGRAWLVALDKNLAPTLELPSEAYGVFNSYGAEFDNMAAGRLVAQLTGRSYKAVGMGYEGANSRRLYVNGARGVLIAEQSICDKTNKVDLIADRKCRC
jgi:hypothetical protein